MRHLLCVLAAALAAPPAPACAWLVPSPAPAAQPAPASAAVATVPARQDENTALTPIPGEAFTETIAGTVLTIEMLPLPLDALPEATRVRASALWIARTELPWEHYDAFVFGLDEPAGEADPPPAERTEPAGPAEPAEPRTAPPPDAVTRPTQPYISVDRGYGHNGHPALSMSARGAEAFCAWLSARTGRRYRLPTEDEWAAACLAGSPGPWHWGDDRTLADAHAWYRGNAQRRTHAVGTKAPNAWGLHDMHGNVAEWCTGTDGPVVRGGSFLGTPEDVAVHARALPVPAWNATDPNIPRSVWWLADAPFVGMRVVCEQPRAGGGDAGTGREAAGADAGGSAGAAERGGR